MKTINNAKAEPSIKDALEKLVSLDVDFYVVGGLLCQYYLKDHARYTKDIDIVFYADRKTVEEKLKSLFGKIEFFYDEETETFYEPSFTCFVETKNGKAQIEGKKINFFNEIKIEQYSYEGISFKGVQIEYVIAEKLVSLLNELSRPYKHLVDIYSFTKIDQSLIDKTEIKRYVSLINAQENQFRKEFGLKEYHLPNQISEHKVLNPPIIIPTLQSKFNVSKEEMILAVNKWLKDF